MQRNLLLELLEDGEHVSLYSPKKLPTLQICNKLCIGWI